MIVHDRGGHLLTLSVATALAGYGSDAHYEAALRAFVQGLRGGTVAGSGGSHP